MSREENLLNRKEEVKFPSWNTKNEYQHFVRYRTDINGCAVYRPDAEPELPGEIVLRTNIA
jgi:hypothetical protein